MPNSTHTTRRSFLKALPVAAIAASVVSILPDGWGPIESYKVATDDQTINHFVASGLAAGYTFGGNGDQLFLAHNFEKPVDYRFFETYNKHWLPLLETIQDWRQRVLSAQSKIVPNLT